MPIISKDLMAPYMYAFSLSTMTKQMLNTLLERERKYLYE